jgi:hypothetical protein
LLYLFLFFHFIFFSLLPNSCPLTSFYHHSRHPTHLVPPLPWSRKRLFLYISIFLVSFSMGHHLAEQFLPTGACTISISRYNWVVSYLENGDNKALQNGSSTVRNRSHISTELLWKPEIFDILVLKNTLEIFYLNTGA